MILSLEVTDSAKLAVAASEADGRVTPITFSDYNSTVKLAERQPTEGRPPPRVLGPLQMPAPGPDFIITALKHFIQTSANIDHISSFGGTWASWVKFDFAVFRERFPNRNYNGFAERSIYRDPTQRTDLVINRRQIPDSVIQFANYRPGASGRRTASFSKNCTHRLYSRSDKFVEWASRIRSYSRYVIEIAWGSHIMEDIRATWLGLWIRGLLESPGRSSLSSQSHS